VNNRRGRGGTEITAGYVAVGGDGGNGKIVGVTWEV